MMGVFVEGMLNGLRMVGVCLSRCVSVRVGLMLCSMMFCCSW